MSGMARTAPLLAAAVLAATLALAGSTPLVFEDNGRRVEPAGRPHHGELAPAAAAEAGRGRPQAAGAGAPLPPAYNAVTPQPPPAATDPDGRGLHKKKKKKKKVICGIASLIAGRDASGGVAAAEQRGPQHRAARAVGQDAYPAGGAPGAPGDARSYGSGLGVAGFLLGTFVGSKLGYGYAQHAPYPQHPHAPAQPLQPTQTQVQQVQTPGVFQQLIPAVPVVPVRPVIPVDPAPVHEDYDDTDQDDEGILAYAGGGGGSLCDQLQNRPDPGPLDSHFPLLAGILNGGGGGHQQQRPYYRPPPRPQYYQRPQQAPAGLLYSYVKPWTDLFFRRR